MHTILRLPDVKRSTGLSHSTIYLRIALARGTVTEYIFAAKIAPAFGLKSGDYEVANVADQKDRIPTLIAKAVDATGIGDPYVAIAEHEGLVRTFVSTTRSHLSRL